MKVGKYEVKEGYFYEKNHAWAKLEGNKILVGISDFFQYQAGEIIFIDLPNVGDEVKQNEPFCSIESGKWVGRIFSPISGKIVEVNERLWDEPALLNKKPYETWIIKVDGDPKELENVMNAEEYAKYLEEEMKKPKYKE